MYEEKVSPELAKKEVANWLDAKRIAPNKRARYADQIESLECAVMYGQVTINSDDRVINHHLAFPIQDSTGVEVLAKLEYKPRLRTEEIQQRLKGVSSSDGSGIVAAVVSALTGQPAAMIGKLDTEDSTIAQSVAVFFL